MVRDNGLVDITNFPTMKRMCKSCPFRDEIKHAELTNRIKKDVLSKASQICHHPRLKGKKETHLCKGARDFQIQIFHKIGAIKEATDECFRKSLMSASK